MRWATAGNGWVLAPALVTLGRQLSRIWPQGGPTDGTIGDAAHRARKSDHNPNSAGVVCAMDVAEVVEDRGAALVAALVDSRDPRIKYVIHERQIWRSYPKPGIPAWRPGPYSGPNAHASHVHISVSSLYLDGSAWNLNALTTEERTETVNGILKAGDTGRSVRLYQQALTRWGWPLEPDGAFGPLTVEAVEAYQRAANLVPQFVDNPDPIGQIGGLTAANLSRYVPYVPEK